MSNNNMVKRGNWLIPDDKVFGVTERVFRNQAHQRCATSLIEDLLERRYADGSSNLDLEVYNYDGPPADWDRERQVEFLEDCGVEVPDPDENWRDYDETLRDVTEETWHEYVNIFEWWRVDENVARNFLDLDQSMVCAYGEWYWGRRTTGQMIYMDHIVEEVAAIYFEWYLDEFPFLERVEEEAGSAT